MDNPDELTEQDLKLLQEIETIVQQGEQELKQANSLLDLCAYIASTAPQANEDFQQRLYFEVVNKLQAKRPERSFDLSFNTIRVSNRWRQNLEMRIEDLVHIARTNRGVMMKKGIVLLSTVVLVLAIFSIAFVPAVQASVRDVVRRIVLGDSLEAIQVASNANSENPFVLDDLWTIRTEIGNYGGNLLPGSESSVRTLESLEEAQALVNFHIRVPSILPEGYSLREIKLPPAELPPSAILFYSGPEHDIIIVQTLNGLLHGDAPNVAIGIATTFVTDGELESVEFDGHSAVWADETILIWESEGISYQVGGLDIDIQQAINIARSLQ